MADFDVLGFVRDMGQRKRAKQFLSQHQETLANGSPDAIAQLMSLDPNNPHLVSGLQNVVAARQSAGTLNLQPVALEGAKLGNALTSEQVTGAKRGNETAQYAFGRTKVADTRSDAARDVFSSEIGYTPEAFTALGNAALLNADVRGKNVQSNVTLSSDERANKGQAFDMSQILRKNLQEDTAASAGGYPSTGSNWADLVRMDIARDDLATRERMAKQENAARLLPGVNEALNMTLDPSSPTFRNYYSAMQQQLGTQLGLTPPPTAAAQPRPGVSAGDKIRDAVSRKLGQPAASPVPAPATAPVAAPQMQPSAQAAPTQGQRPQEHKYYELSDLIKDAGNLFAPKPTTPLTSQVSQIAKQYPEFFNDPRRPKFTKDNLDPLEVLSWAREAQRRGMYDQEALQRVINEFMSMKRP